MFWFDHYKPDGLAQGSLHIFPHPSLRNVGMKFLPALARTEDFLSSLEGESHWVR